jgi:hypothetical protein
LRYRTDEKPADGLHGGEGTFLLCTFWLVQAPAQRGDYEEATSLFKRAVSLSNDVGLLGEEYDVEHDRMVGTFPQAFLSHRATGRCSKPRIRTVTRRGLRFRARLAGSRSAADRQSAGLPEGVTTSQSPPYSVTLWHKTWFLPSSA